MFVCVVELGRDCRVIFILVVMWFLSLYDC